MASGRIRSTRRLRSWMVDQVSSGRYPGLIWDDLAKTMFRIPWKHAGKQDFRSDEDAAIFKAWAKFKGKLLDGGRSDPASWKTRLRCALNKSSEFAEVAARSQLDISEPYKVYRLVPIAEQGLVDVKTDREKAGSNRKKRRRRSQSEDSEEEDEEEEEVAAKVIKEEVIAVETISMVHLSSGEVDYDAGNDVTIQTAESTVILKSDGTVDEIQLNMTIETAPARGALHSFLVTVHYVGQEVLRREISGSDVRIAYLPPSSMPPSPLSLFPGFLRIPLPEPPTSMTSDPGLVPNLQAIATLLPVMEKGVVLTSMAGGVYAKRLCQGRVFWRGPHALTAAPRKMERALKPESLFNREVFRQELERFQSFGGEPPQTDITLCFGEELYDTDDPADKHIIIKISLPWAERQIQEAQAFRESLTFLQTLASQSPLGEVTLNLISVP